MQVAAPADASSRRVSLPPLPGSVREARAFIRTALADPRHGHLVDDAELAVSELVTNALVHAGTVIELTVAVGGDAVRVGVSDGSPRLPRARGYADTAGTGRGLRLLNELVTDWGADEGEAGKTVWFDLAVTEPSTDGAVRPHPGGPDSGAPVDQPASERATGSVTVQLRDTPVLLYAAWRQHAEALLREYFLVQLDRGSDEEAVRVHSEASDALAVLDEAVPAAPDTASPATALAAATAPEATASVLVQVQAFVRDHFATLDVAMQQALELAADQFLLTPAVQPELRLLRRWVCDQVRTQYDGAPPIAWVPMGTSEALTPALTPAGRTETDWDATAVTGSPRALMAADDVSTIVAASPAALALLGYDSDDQLLGRRLISVIPERFRQAHLAGLTFHLLTGKGALLGATVTVPVLRRDDTETLVHLALREVHAEDGRPVFVADLEAADDPAPEGVDDGQLEAAVPAGPPPVRG